MKPLDVDEFETLLDVHGPNWERWPETERTQAQSFMASSEPARSAFRAAEQLEVALSLLPGVGAASGVGDRVMRLARAEPRARFSWWPFGSPLPPLLVWVGAAALGLWVGSVSELDDMTESETDGAAMEAAASNDDWSELSVLGLAADWAAEEEP